MDITESLVEIVFSWLDQQKKCADIVGKVASELLHRKNIERSKTVGRKAVWFGSAYVAAGSLVTLLTAGLAAPFFIAGGIVGALGVATTAGSAAVGAFIPNKTKEAEESGKKSRSLAEEIERLVDLLKNEWEEKERKALTGMNREDFTITEILKAMARHWGLPWHDNFKFLISDLNTKVPMFTEENSLLSITLSAPLLLNLISAGLFKGALTISTITDGLRVVKGVIDLAFAIPEMAVTWMDKDVEPCQFQTLGESIKKDAASFEAELIGIRDILNGISKFKISPSKTIERKLRGEILDFVMERCRDTTIRKWLQDNRHSYAFLKLVEMFSFLEEIIQKENKKNHSTEVDITFLAHGSICNPMIPASCLMPLPTIKDVILYTPWNCNLGADAAYCISIGRMLPVHRVFRCCGTKTRPCKIAPTCHKAHQPKDLPNYWNLMKNAGAQEIPNIMLSPVGSKEDKAWERFHFLEVTSGGPGRNRITVPYIRPESAHDTGVPFSVVTLALSAVLMNSKFCATVHLTACLGKRLGEELDEAWLQHQYNYTIDRTSMYSTLRLDPPQLFKDVFY